MFDFKSANFRMLAREAKCQGFSLNKLYSKGEGIGYLVYRGCFGGKENFAYARLSSVDKSTDLYDNLSYIHSQLKRYM